MNTPDTRAAFEALIANGPLSYLTAQRMDNGEYISKRTRAAWTAYQAATEAAKAEIAAPVLSDEQILTIAKKELGHWNYEDDVVAFAQAILAATRSQP